jgi:hypothetical protein
VVHVTSVSAVVILLSGLYIRSPLAYPGGWFGKVLKKLGQIPSSVEYMSVTTNQNTGFAHLQIE